MLGGVEEGTQGETREANLDIEEFVHPPRAGKILISMPQKKQKL